MGIPEEKNKRKAMRGNTQGSNCWDFTRIYKNISVLHLIRPINYN